MLHTGAVYKVRCILGGRGGPAIVVTLFNVQGGEGGENWQKTCNVLCTRSLRTKESYLFGFHFSKDRMSFQFSASFIE